MKIRIALVFLIACTALAPRASAQWYTADSYYSYSLSSDGTTLYTDVTLEGQVNSSAPPTAKHSYTNHSSLNGSPMTKTGGPTRNYISLTNSQQVAVTPGQIINYYDEEQVNCNIMGLVYDGSASIKFEVAYTRVASLGTQSNCSVGPIIICDLAVQAWCTPQSTPPDMDITAVRVEVYPIPPSPFYDAEGVLVSVNGGPWYFNNLTSWAIGLPSPQNLAVCTKTR